MSAIGCRLYKIGSIGIPIKNTLINLKIFKTIKENIENYKNDCKESLPILVIITIVLVLEKEIFGFLFIRLVDNFDAFCV